MTPAAIIVAGSVAAAVLFVMRVLATLISKV